MQWNLFKCDIVFVVFLYELDRKVTLENSKMVWVQTGYQNSIQQLVGNWLPENFDSPLWKRNSIISGIANQIISCAYTHVKDNLNNLFEIFEVLCYTSECS